MVASVSLATLKKEVARPPMVALLAIWLRLLSMIASVNLATAKKDGCAKNRPNTDHTWESIGDTDHTWESIGDRHRRRQRHQTYSFNISDGFVSSYDTLWYLSGQKITTA